MKRLIKHFLILLVGIIMFKVFNLSFNDRFMIAFIVIPWTIIIIVDILFLFRKKKEVESN